MRAKFKFKFVLNTVNYCVFCLFRFCKMTLNLNLNLSYIRKNICQQFSYEFPITYGFGWAAFADFASLEG
jgi:hypothetical protein